jgi:hypothetical protein
VCVCFYILLWHNLNLIFHSFFIYIHSAAADEAVTRPNTLTRLSVCQHTHPSVGPLVPERTQGHVADLLQPYRLRHGSATGARHLQQDPKHERSAFPGNKENRGRLYGRRFQHILRLRWCCARSCGLV